MEDYGSRAILPLARAILPLASDMGAPMSLVPLRPNMGGCDVGRGLSFREAARQQAFGNFPRDYNITKVLLEKAARTHARTHARKHARTHARTHAQYYQGSFTKEHEKRDPIVTHAHAHTRMQQSALFQTPPLLLLFLHIHACNSARSTSCVCGAHGGKSTQKSALARGCFARFWFACASLV